MKHYDNDWAKAKARELLKSEIVETLLKFRKPKELRVLCFPGIDALEVFQVYDALGIPRQNITGVEMVPEIADQIEQKAQGIKVVRKKLEDYVEEHNSFNFDVISLDYTSQFSEEIFESIAKLYYKNLRKHLLLNVCVQARRESSETQEFLLNLEFIRRYQKICGAIIEKGSITPDMELNYLFKELNESKKLGGHMKNIRGDSLS